MDNKEICCLNCGTCFEGNFCPNCGQKASVRRFSFRSLTVESVWNILRMDSRVLPTMWLLITRPWIVIKEYLYGRRVSYTQPVRLLVILCLVGTVVDSLLGIQPEAAAGEMAGSGGGLLASFWHSLTQFVAGSRIAKDILESIGGALVVWLCYLPFGSRRFSLPEYCIAYLYTCCFSLQLDILFKPVALLAGSLPAHTPFVKWLLGILPDVLSIGWNFTLSLLLVWRVFRIRPLWLRVLMIAVTIGAFFVFYFLAAMIAQGIQAVL